MSQLFIQNHRHLDSRAYCFVVAPIVYVEVAYRFGVESAFICLHISFFLVVTFLILLFRSTFVTVRFPLPSTSTTLECILSAYLEKCW